MPTSFVQVALQVWRDFKTNNVPASGKHSPLKADIRTWGKQVEDALDGVIPINGLNSTGNIQTAGQFVGRGTIPIGGIIMWSGTIATIPAGWALCNGANGTPDLRDRFVVGAGTTYSVGNIGGAASVGLTPQQLPAHTHGTGSLSVGLTGAHQHSFFGTTSWADLQGEINSSPRGSFADSGNWGIVGQGFEQRVHGSGTGLSNAFGKIRINASHNHTVGGATSVDGNHSHGLSGLTGSTGGGEVHENRPPYFALAYIMRVN